MSVIADKSTTGLKKETAAALSYVFGPITGFVMLILEKDSFVRFHAMQSMVVFGIYVVLEVIFGIIPVIGIGIDSLLTLTAFILWLVLIYKALNGEKWEVPILGSYVNKLLK